MESQAHGSELELATGTAAELPSDAPSTTPLALGARGRLTIRAPAGFIVVEGSEGAPTLELRGAQLGERVVVNSTDEGVDISVLPGDERAAGAWRSRLRLVVRVPPSLRTRVQLASGRVRFRGLVGAEVDLELASGIASLRDVTGLLRLRVSNGRIDANNVAGRFDMEVESGAIRVSVRGIEPGNHRLYTRFGAIRAHLAAGLAVEVVARSEHGSVRNRYPVVQNASSKLELLAASGSVRVSSDTPEAVATASTADQALGARRVLDSLRRGRISRVEAEVLLDSLGFGRVDDDRDRG